MKKELAPGASAYAAAGVDIDVKMAALRRVRRWVESTHAADAGAAWGLFGGLYRSPGRNTLLVSSIDGVGTKLMVARMVGRHNTVGQDLVNHCVNDILAQGAEPLFFLDYFGTGRLQPQVFEEVVAGLCRACRQNGCALVGGETAEMPGLYPESEYDLVGVIVGAVDRRRVITGKDIRTGDVLIGLHSSGLHTNGYTLARRILFGPGQLNVRDTFPGLRRSVGDVLLAVHRSYLKPVRALWQHVRIRGLAHITGGGFSDNIARLLPDDTRAVVDRASWKAPTLFSFLQTTGRVDHEEMYRVFNMGIGMVVIVRGQDAQRALDILREAGERPRIIGRIERGRGDVRMIH